MENITIEVKAKQVGNSLAIFMPADSCAALDIEANSELVAHIHKKKEKNIAKLASLYGILKGKKLSWSCKEDRSDVWGE